MNEHCCEKRNRQYVVNLPFTWFRKRFLILIYRSKIIIEKCWASKMFLRVTILFWSFSVIPAAFSSRIFKITSYEISKRTVYFGDFELLICKKNKTLFSQNYLYYQNELLTKDGKIITEILLGKLVTQFFDKQQKSILTTDIYNAVQQFEWKMQN